MIPEPLDGQLPPVVGQGMQHDRGVLTGFDHLVEVADRPLPHRMGQRPVHPDRFITLQQVSTDQVSGGEVVMAGHGDQRAAEIVSHRLDEAGLAAPGGPLQHQRQTLAIGRLEHGLLVAHRLVVRARRIGLRHGAILIRDPGLGAHSAPFVTRFVAVGEA